MVFIIIISQQYHPVLITMKILLLTTLVALAYGDVSHLLNQGYQYQGSSFENQPLSSYGAPQASVLGSLAGSGSGQSISYRSSEAGSVPQLSLPAASGPTLSFNSGASSLSGATIQTYDNGGFSTPVPLTQDAYDRLQASTPAPGVDISGFQSKSSVGSDPSVNFVKYQEPSSQQSNSYQFLSKLSQPSQSTIAFNSARFGVDSGSFGGESQLNAGLGFGGATSGFPAASSFDSQLNSGLGIGIGGSQFVSKSSGFGGSIDDSFGVVTNAAENAAGSLEPEVSKHLYFFDAPEDEEEEIDSRVVIPPVAPKKTYKIIFIKAPSYRNQGTITIPAPPVSEEKTLVYVLVKKPEKNANVRFEPAAPTAPSKPEVFFIKYKTQKEAEAAVAEIQNKHGASGQVIANLPAGQSIDHIQIPSNIGVSSGTSSFGGIKSGGFGGDSFDSIGIRTLGSSAPSSFGFQSRSGVVESQQTPADSSSAQSENEQTNVQIGQVDTSTPATVGFGQQSALSFQGVGPAVASSHSEVSGSNVESQSNIELGASNQESDSDDNESKNESSESQPEVPEKNEESENGVQERVDSDDNDGVGSNLSAFKTYGPPNPTLFKKYGPPEA